MMLFMAVKQPPAAPPMQLELTCPERRMESEECSPSPSNAEVPKGLAAIDRTLPDHDDALRLLFLQSYAKACWRWGTCSRVSLRLMMWSVTERGLCHLKPPALPDPA